HLLGSTVTAMIVYAVVPINSHVTQAVPDIHLSLIRRIGRGFTEIKHWNGIKKIDTSPCSTCDVNKRHFRRK
ncbi:MAG: hypothetical protein ABW098_20505, partial [Candidatus Thiodiazotropha sp.]